MSKTTQSWLMGLLGAALIMITATGRFTSYVKPGFGPLLLIAGAVLIAVAVASIALGIRDDIREERAGYVHDEATDDADVVTVNELSLRSAAARGAPDGLNARRSSAAAQPRSATTRPTATPTTGRKRRG